MKIDEVIEKYRNRAKQYKDWDNMKDIAEEHAQLVEWLEDYQRVKKWKDEVMEEFCRYDASSIEELVQRATNKAIYDFASELENHSIYADIGKGNTVKIEFVAPITRIRDVAQQLKAGGIDGNERTNT